MFFTHTGPDDGLNHAFSVVDGYGEWEQARVQSFQAGAVGGVRTTHLVEVLGGWFFFSPRCFVCDRCFLTPV